MPPKRTVTAAQLMRLVGNGATLEQDVPIDSLKELIEAQRATAASQALIIEQLANMQHETHIDLAPIERLIGQLTNVQPQVVVVPHPVKEYVFERNQRGLIEKIIPVPNDESI